MGLEYKITNKNIKVLQNWAIGKTNKQATNYHILFLALSFSINSMHYFLLKNPSRFSLSKVILTFGRYLDMILSCCVCLYF